MSAHPDRKRPHRNLAGVAFFVLGVLGPACGSSHPSENPKIIRSGSFPAWCGANDLITFTDDMGGQYEVFSMRPDGSDATCLTCDKPALANCGNRGQSYWHPGGQYIVFHAEDRGLPRIGLGSSARPGYGRNFNVWIMTADGRSFWRMTDTQENWAVMETKFSHDGAMIFWNEEFSMEKYPNGKPGDGLMPWSRPTGWPWGHPGAYYTREQFTYRVGEEMLCWRVVIGVIDLGPAGPRITQIRRIEPPAGFTLNESNGFTPDDSGVVGCYSNLAETDGHAFWGELYTADLGGRLTRRLTRTVRLHDEDPAFSPDGRRIVYKETSGYPGQGDDIYLMDADGGNSRRLTHFTEPGYPEYDPKAAEDANRSEWEAAYTRITEMHFSPDGRRIVFGRCRYDPAADPRVEIPSDLYILALPEGLPAG